MPARLEPSHDDTQLIPAELLRSALRRRHTAGGANDTGIRGERQSRSSTPELALEWSDLRRMERQMVDLDVAASIPG